LGVEEKKGELLATPTWDREVSGNEAQTGDLGAKKRLSYYIPVGLTKKREAAVLELKRDIYAAKKKS